MELRNIFCLRPLFWAKKTLSILALISALMPIGWAAPCFGKPVIRHQPDGQAVELFLWGDEFLLVAETRTGYTVVQDASNGFYCYARRSTDGTTLISTGVHVGAADPAALALIPHERIAAHEHARIQTQRRQAAGLRTTEPGRGHWRGRSPAIGNAAARYEPPARTTIGTFQGLCLLIDFSDDPATYPRAELDDLMNQIGYSGQGNRGSVYDYFFAVSNGKVRYTNILPTTALWATGYYRAKNPRSYYDKASDRSGLGAQTLIREALTDLVGKGFDFSSLSYTSASGERVAYALNVLYAGEEPTAWATGLWPHSSELSPAFPVGPNQKISHYQITNMPSEPDIYGNPGHVSIGTICHENGHMLCNFPDLYDYTSSIQPVPVGAWCLMGAGASGNEGLAPTGVCGYLRDHAGWIDVVDLTDRDSGLVKTVDAAFMKGNAFRLRRDANEYFLIESRHRSGVDTYLPGSGLAVYHVDERGSNTDRARAPSGNWECTLVQADARHDLETGEQYIGKARFAFSGSGQATFAFESNPAPVWWNGTPSSLAIRRISTPASAMTFTLDAGPQWIDTSSAETDSGGCGMGSGLSLAGLLTLLTAQGLRRRKRGMT